MDRNEAIKATRNGAIAACISLALATIIVIMTRVLGPTEHFAEYADSSVYFDLILIAIFAFGMYRKSRLASVLMFIYFAACKVVMFVENQAIGNIIGAVIFLYFYAKAIQGAFVYHRIEKAENPDYKPTPLWLKVTGGIFVLLVVGILGMGAMVMTGAVPETSVQSGADLRSKDLHALIENRIITEEDTVEFFYSHGFSSILEGGNLLTNDRVILYQTNDDDEIEVYELFCDEITEVRQTVEGDFFRDSEYIVNTGDSERWITLILSVDEEGDKKFVEAIQSKTAKNTTRFPETIEDESI